MQRFHALRQLLPPNHVRTPATRLPLAQGGPATCTPSHPPALQSRAPNPRAMQVVARYRKGEHMRSHDRRVFSQALAELMHLHAQGMAAAALTEKELTKQAKVLIRVQVRTGLAGVQVRSAWRQEEGAASWWGRPRRPPAPRRVLGEGAASWPGRLRQACAALAAVPFFPQDNPGPPTCLASLCPAATPT
jgi:hypothetical protein